jgi:hypothetical protein
LQHQLAALTRASRQRHALPTDKKSRPWLLSEETN